MIRQSVPRIILLEPYYGGSHRVFIDGLQKNLTCSFTRFTLPARKWKMRMQLAAPWMAEKVLTHIRAGKPADAILCSSLLDVATFRAMLIQSGTDLPVGVYFHENQFNYPSQKHDPASYQFAALNFTTALAADSIAFNSEFNRATFLEGVTGYLKKAADMDILHLVEALTEKSTVLYPGIDYTVADTLRARSLSPRPVLVWNHRWEHDKDPETFFQALFELDAEGIDFGLIVLGQSFSRCPDIFQHAREKLADRVLHFGYARKREDYLGWLCRANLAVSTARHEFFGIAVLEAVRCGCRPLVPDSLAYRELFPKKYRYSPGKFKTVLYRAVKGFKPVDEKKVRSLTEPYAWHRLAGQYEHWLDRLCRRS